MARRKRLEMLSEDGERQLDLFIPLFTDVAPRDVQDTMAYPFFHTSKRKRLKPIEYDDGRVSIYVEGLQSVGIANIYDKDILQWGIARVREHIDSNLPGQVQPKIFFNPYDLLKELGRDTGGKNYRLLENTLERLATTFVKTTIREEDIQEKKGFHWLSEYTTKTDIKRGEPRGMWSLTLSHWLYQGAVNHKNVLTFNSKYFALSSGIAKFLYLLGRKYAGHNEWGKSITMKKVFELSASTREYKYFARDVREVIASHQNIFADYYIKIWSNEEGDEEKIAFTSLKYMNPSIAKRMQLTE